MLRKISLSVEQRFEKWYIKPLYRLEHCIEEGDGAIAALMVAMPLYERYLAHELKNNDSLRPPFVQKELGFSTLLESQLFWNVFRDGLCHRAHFFEESTKSTEKLGPLPKVSLHNDNPPFPVFGTDPESGKQAIYLNPWKFIAFILSKYENNLPLKEKADAPLLPVWYIIDDKIP